METTKVGDRTAIQQEQKTAWDMVDDLWGGTSSMRRAEDKWLPREPKEAKRAYENRLLRSFLYNGYKRAVENIAGKPFAKPVTVKQAEALPEPLDAIEADVDRTGRSLTQFAKEVLTKGVHYGIHFALVDFPRRENSSGMTRTLEDDRREGVRPVFVHVTAQQILGVKLIKENGIEVVDQIRIHEMREEENGEYGTKKVDLVRVLTRDSWEIHKKDADQGSGSGEDWQLDSSGTHTFGRVPVFPFYVNRTGFFQGQPALEDLAWTNIAHWQSSSDQRSILRFARVGLLAATGLSKDEKRQEIVVGANRVVKTTNPDARLYYVEHSGAAIKSGERDLEMLESQMRHLSMQPFMQRTGNVTATARALATAESDSMVQSWVRLLEDFLEELYRAAAQWVGSELPSEFAINVQKDFTLSLRGDEDLKELREMVNSGLISHETYLREIKRRGVLHEGTNIDEELERVSSEAPRSIDREVEEEDIPTTSPRTPREDAEPPASAEAIRQAEGVGAA